jgi:L-seryl-tRNA(Ser) seleniumtransferase
VEELLQSDALSEVLINLPRPIVTQIVRDEVTRARREIVEEQKSVSSTTLIGRITRSAAKLKRREISRVINATGIIVHTNLGRAPLSESLFDAIKATVTGYGNIEFDTSSGKRGHRGEAAEHYLAALAGAEAGTIVNNCAAALFLILNTLAHRKSVVISRGELVQIGGGFRIPDILKRSGAKLAEIGTTNITRLADYESALDEGGQLILKVHQSNFVQAGFTEGASLKDLVALGEKHHVSVVNDLGSGVFLSTRNLIGYDEPTVQQSVRDGAALTCFSGDKLLGGMQAGLIVGKEELIKKVKRNPIFRTVRVDKVVYSVLEKLLGYYLDGTHADHIKLWSLLSIPESTLYGWGKAIVRQLGNPEGVSVSATGGRIGGGALPEVDIPSVGIIFDPRFKSTRLVKQFREQNPPIIGRVEDDHFILDLKAIDESDLAYVAEACERILREV